MPIPAKNPSNDRSPMENRAELLRKDLASKVAQSIGPAEVLETAISGLTLFRRTVPNIAVSGTYEPSVAMVVQGRKRVELAQRTFFYDPSQFLLTSVDLPVISQIIEASEDIPYLCMRLKLEMPMVRELLSREEIHVRETHANDPAMITAETTEEFLDAFLRLINLLRTPEDIPFVSPLIQREIVYRILRSAEGQRLRRIATVGDQSHRTAKAITWIRTNYAKPLRVEELADLAGMGISTLHHHFRVLTSMSPLQYQKQLRLQTARQRMLMDGLDATSAAFEVGYESVSQFNREYSRFFGQPPMRDVRTLRSTNAAAIGAVHSEGARV